MTIITTRLIVSILAILAITLNASAQDEKKEKVKFSLKDSLDNKLDLSDVIIHKNGFVPMPILITEPALGGFGGGLAPIFIKQNKPVEYDGKLIPIPPDITAGFGAYTLNDTWVVGGRRMGNISKWGIRYVISGGYANVNMDYYFNLGQANKDANFEFNIRTIPVFTSITKQLKDPRFTIGIQYRFMHNEVKLKNNHGNTGELIEKLEDKIGGYITSRVSGNVAKLGTKVAYDSRDNTFTPNKGIKTYVSADWSNPLVGSDYKYGQLEGAFYCYLPLSPNLITGTRFDMQQVIGDNQPFYIKPYIDIRGVPTVRFSGKTTALAEVEQRWDFTKRWSIIAFAGGGKAFDKYDEFSDAQWAWGYGGGFRYLMARKLKLRMGVDFANGPEGFAYYLVFGSNWLRQ